MQQLQGKSILFFCPSFFGYEKEIAEKLRDLGAMVDAYDERPKNNFVMKASIRINKKLVKKAIAAYYGLILKQTAHKTYDYVFVVNIEAMLPAVLEKLKAQQPKAIFILYMWDSLQNKKQTPEILPYFDRAYSFDPTDLTNIPGVKFRPLFFIDQYADLAKQKTEAVNGLSFIGTVHSDRYQLVKEVKKQVAAFNLRTSFFMYFPSPMLFAYKKLIDIKFYQAKYSEFNFHALSQTEIIKRIANTKVVLDIQHPSQTGLTMRSLEMLGAQKKLITTNTAIRNYDFYHEQNIHIIDRQQPVLNQAFFESDYHPVAPDLYFKYSITGWLHDLFEL